MTKLRLIIEPLGEGSQGRREAVRASMQASGYQPTRSRDEEVDTYLIDLDALFPALLELHELGIAPTEFRVDLDRPRSRPCRSTEQAHRHRVAAIAIALLTVNDLDRMGHFAVGIDLRVVVEALLLLLHTTQQDLAASTQACCQQTIIE
jgi:hypothetical protein